MRQQWINDLRSLLSEVSSSGLHYFQTGFEDRSEEESMRLADLEHKTIFMINPNEPKHQELIKVIRNMLSALERGREGESDFISSYENLLEVCRAVLKKEWSVLKRHNQSPPRTG